MVNVCVVLSFCHEYYYPACAITDVPLCTIMLLQLGSVSNGRSISYTSIVHDIL